MLNENMIKVEHLEILWSLTKKKDIELKLAIYKLLSDNFYIPNFNKPIIEFFLEKIAKDCDPSHISTEDIELV